MVCEGLTFGEYNTCFFDGETIYREQILFENKNQELYTMSKIALRLVQADGIATLARVYVASST